MLVADPPPEMGDIKWLTDLEEVQIQSEKSGKPILVLFQEVPG